ncbi:MAG: transcription elongation factor GreA [Candidatus Shapirobacteria bacterium]|nr:transcription elongation factor GreA [Candidatus Shapirobacteria bacterium]MDD5073840.1 transcription elongation factor GreA [Candidatus Shapirobacteria bacterium]MDD5481813.1 transcription elongation factor GreA [Candidatus Shapirobacteria bacterium]
MIDKKLMTKQGLENLKKKLAGLEAQRPEAVERVEAARQMGDLRENSEYHAAREDLTLLDTQIEELQAVLANAKIASAANGGSRIGLESLVTIKNDSGQELVYQLVGEHESDPLNRKISYTSPLGQALMNRGAGDRVTADTPGGKVEYQIVAVK